MDDFRRVKLGTFANTTAAQHVTRDDELRTATADDRRTTTTDNRRTSSADDRRTRSIMDSIIVANSMVLTGSADLLDVSSPSFDQVHAAIVVGQMLRKIGDDFNCQHILLEKKTFNVSIRTYILYIVYGLIICFIEAQRLPASVHHRRFHGTFSARALMGM